MEDYIIDIEEYLDKDREARAQSRRNKALKKAKDRAKVLIHDNPIWLEHWGYDLNNSSDLEKLLSDDHKFRIAFNRIEGQEDLERPRRRYLPYQDYEDKPVCVVSLEPVWDLVYVLKTEWI